jgi:hypothetical protein
MFCSKVFLSLDVVHWTGDNLSVEGQTASPIRVGSKVYLSVDVVPWTSDNLSVVGQTTSPIRV